MEGQSSSPDEGVEEPDPQPEGLRTGAWFALAAAVIGVGAILLGALFFADEQEMPVPYEFGGRSCWQFGDDLLRCKNDEYFVRHLGSWRKPSSCHPLDSSVLVCNRPYALRIEADDSHVRLRHQEAESS